MKKRPDERIYKLVLRVEFDMETRVLIDEFIRGPGQTAESTHGALTLEKLAAMLLEDVALAIRRPGSWEGSNMIQVLTSHGYGPHL